MNCPHCTDTQLAIADRQGIEIDYCPKCRGVWLDRGELEKFLERSVKVWNEYSAGHEPRTERPREAEPPRRDDDDKWRHGRDDDRSRRDDDDDDKWRRGREDERRRRRDDDDRGPLGFLGEIFDF